MAKKKPSKKAVKKLVNAPKQRTREHVIASLSANHVERVIIERGWVAQRVENDYGYDLVLQTFSAEGYVEPGFALLQLKAKDSLVLVGGNRFVSFGIGISDYRTWMKEVYPVFLIVYDASRRVAYWLDVQNYFNEDSSRQPVGKTITVAVRIPIKDVFSDTTLEYMKDRKDEVMAHYQQVKNG